MRDMIALTLREIFEFKVIQIVDIGGDHDIVVGEPVGAEVLKESEVEDILTLPHIGWSYAG